jgi:opacity protein-like surface antigen
VSSGFLFKFKGRKMIKKIITFFSALFLLCFQSVKAEEMYVGLDYLKNEIETGITNISSNLDEDDEGYSLYAGWPINENLDIEASYQDFGEASLSGVSGNQFKYEGTTYEFNTTATLAASATSFGFAAKPKFEISDGVMLYGKLGVHNWKSELSITSTTVTASADEDGTDVFYGGGIQVSLENLNGRVGYSKFDLDGEDVNSINLGLSYNF